MLSELDQGDALIIGEEDLARHLQEDKSNSRFSPIRRYAFFLRAKLQLSASPEKQLIYMWRGEFRMVTNVWLHATD